MAPAYVRRLRFQFHHGHAVVEPCRAHPFFVGGGAGGFLGSLVPMAAWLNPHSTTGYAVEVSKFLNIQSLGMQFMLTSMVRSGLTMEEARAACHDPERTRLANSSL